MTEAPFVHTCSCSIHVAPGSWAARFIEISTPKLVLTFKRIKFRSMILPVSVQEAIDDERLFELLKSTSTRDVIHERLRVLENIACVAVLRTPRFKRGKNKYWAIKTSITLSDLERGMVSMGHMSCSRNPSRRQKCSRSIKLYVLLYLIYRKRPTSADE